MNRSESVIEISKALVKAQSKIGGAVKSANNPFYKSKYSDLNSVIQACKEELNNEGISVLQPVTSDEQGDYVETILLHTSGEYISSRMKLVLSKQDMQAYGSAISYARRYSLQSMVFIPSSEDDDAEATMNRVSKTSITKPILVSPEPVDPTTTTLENVPPNGTIKSTPTTRTFRGRTPTSVSSLSTSDNTGMNF